jgi:cyclopropane-fatty-acyl-phospholipid synthase
MQRSLLEFSSASRAFLRAGWEKSVLRRLLSAFIHRGTLIVRGPDGSEMVFGDLAAPRVAVRIRTYRAMLALALDPELALGELFMEGQLTVEDGGNVADLLDLLFVNVARFRKSQGIWRLLHVVQQLRLRWLRARNSRSRARASAAHHYDLSGRLYELFLDSDLQYSCAYYSDSASTLDEAQVGKKRHIISKLLLDRPGLKILDVGCGWGGMALDLARDFEASVRGITLSEEQVIRARNRAADAGLSELCQFELSDYRDLVGRYDRIVSVGMFEHVGPEFYEGYFTKARELLDDEGVMLLHTIGRSDAPGTTNAWIAKYIFPGGYVPSLSEILVAVERSGLVVTDIEVLRLHYAKTLMEWRNRFEANREEIARLYDERFCRMWEFYLAGSEMAFRHDNHVVFQLQLAKRVDAVPLTRDYMVDIERAIRSAIRTETLLPESRANKPRLPRRVA